MLINSTFDMPEIRISKSVAFSEHLNYFGSSVLDFFEVMLEMKCVKISVTKVFRNASSIKVCDINTSHKVLWVLYYASAFMFTSELLLVRGQEVVLECFPFPTFCSST